MQKNMLELNDSNLDEFLYKFSGETPKGFIWRARMRLKWWWEEYSNEHFKGSNVKRQFLHSDLQALRYLPISRGEIHVIRFLNEKGEFVAQEFKVVFGYAYIELMEVEGSTPYPAKPPKGPKTWRLAAHTNSKFTWWAFSRVRGWSVHFNKTL